MEAVQVRLKGLKTTIQSYFQSGHAPSVYPTLPPPSLLDVFPPPPEPQALPPPVSDATFARPFNVSSEVYNDALHVSIPIAIAIVYALAAYYLNRVNRRRDNKPWSFSKTSVFYGLVLLHNLFLAAYSAWTCIGMINAISHTWPAWEGEHKLARAADALCKLHGPRGYGSAATFNSRDNTWSFTDRVMKLDQGLPDATDVGRLWNEGLAFYGWLFYLSKFYEVVDTFIILAKGKNTAFFQTYHHTGAMFCVWAGIRYMSPPIWMFVIVNSGIHTLMYTYYTLNHLGIQVTQELKSVLTTMQIVQFVFGATYALAHLFIAYDIPVETPYLFVHNLSSALPSAASSVSSAIASATVSADFGSWLKKAALRAAGEEGLAENVRNAQGQTFGIDAMHAAEVEKAQEEIRYRIQYQRVNCLDTSGETFAILLNFFYLAPLTFMFVQFFVSKYTKNARSSSPPSKTKNVQQSGKGAAKDLRKELEDAMSTEQNDRETKESDVPSELASKTERINKGTEDLGNKTKHAADRAKDGIHQANDALQDKLQAATDTASERINEQNRRWHEYQKEQESDLKKTKAEENEKERAKQASSKCQDPKDEPASNSSDPPANEAFENPQGNAPKLEPTSSSADGPTKKPQSRSVSPQKKTQLPRPRSKNRSVSPDKKDHPPKEEEKPQTNGDVDGTKDSKEEANGNAKGDKKEDDPKPSSLDESAYEVNPDELENEDEKKAQAEVQPKLS
ncbi:MAG: hypothetical protein Q9225_003196 [Loekoesia sp. 1 TL-2023]